MKILITGGLGFGQNLDLRLKNKAFQHYFLIKITQTKKLEGDD